MSDTAIITGEVLQELGARLSRVETLEPLLNELNNIVQDGDQDLAWGDWKLMMANEMLKEYKRIVPEMVKVRQILVDIEEIPHHEIEPVDNSVLLSMFIECYLKRVGED